MKKYYLGAALEELGKSIMVRDDELDRGIVYVRRAADYLHSFFTENSIESLPFTEEEAEKSRSLHSFMRKCDDSSESVILYNFISKDKAMRIWQAFLKGVGAKNSFRDGINAADKAYREGSQDSDEMVMFYTLKSWGEDSWASAKDWLNE